MFSHGTGMRRPKGKQEQRTNESGYLAYIQYVSLLEMGLERYGCDSFISMQLYNVAHFPYVVTVAGSIDDVR